MMMDKLCAPRTILPIEILLMVSNKPERHPFIKTLTVSTPTFCELITMQMLLSN
jgi:hypothetical protein